MVRDQFMSFYDYMMNYPHRLPDRLALAAELRNLAKYHHEVKEIDSMMDLFMVSRLLKGDAAIEAASGGLWCEYCTACNRPTS